MTKPLMHHYVKGLMKVVEAALYFTKGTDYEEEELIRVFKDLTTIYTIEKKLGLRSIEDKENSEIKGELNNG